MWERRYAFPQPVRDDRGERLYPPEQIERLRVVQALIASGLRPGPLMGLSLAELQAQVGIRATRQPVSGDPLITILQAHDVQALLQQLRQDLVRLGLERFVMEVAASGCERVGRAWAHGAIQIYEEHLYTQALQLVLGHAILSLMPGPAKTSPRVLLATLPSERHGLGLMMVQALLLSHQCECLSLGVSVPIDQIVDAARACQCDIVAISCSASLNPAEAVRGLAILRQGLPAPVALWAGGACPALSRLRLDAVTTLRSLEHVGPAVAVYR